MTKKLLFNWGISDTTGWGIYGMNLLEWGMKSEAFRLIPFHWPPSLLNSINQLRIMQLETFAKSMEGDQSWNSNDIALIHLGNQIQIPTFNSSIKEVGVIFFESNPVSQENIEKLKKLHAVVTGSSWNSEKLTEAGVPNYFQIQGVDTDLFRPQDKRIYTDRFVVFSGGKLEYRKGQDIVLAAFKIFSNKYPDALLINCWRSPWEAPVAHSINFSGLCKEFYPSKDMGQSINDWIRRNGIKDENFLSLDLIPNILMPEILREVDLAVFPNRCEGGTNLVAMEALSSGVPCAISKNTGHLDLIQGNNCFPLAIQGSVNKVDGLETCEWGESSVDELVAVMEGAYTKKMQLNQAEIRSSMLSCSWKNSIGNLLQYLEKI
jgi:glycosyltransferase involved in cell wall biosynthesis